MPYPNEHAARMQNPDKYVRVRRENDKFGPGIHALWGVTQDGKAELQAIRFDKSKFTEMEAKTWLKDHNHHPMTFEGAIKEMIDTIFFLPFNFQLEDNEKWQKIIYSGDFDHGAYGAFNVTENDLKKAYENLQQGVGMVKDAEGNHVLPFGYNHAEYDPNPENAKASGHGKKFRFAGNAIEALVEWTEKAKEYIKNKEFQWFSPEFKQDWKDENGINHGFTLLGGSLCNRPFLKKGQMAIAFTDNGPYSIQFIDNTAKAADNETNSKELEMQELESIKMILALDEGADVIGAVKSLTEKNAELEKKVQDSETGNKTLTDKINALDDRVKKGEQASKELNDIKIAQLMDSALRDGKIVPAQTEEYKKLAEKDYEQAKKLIEATPKHSLFDTLGSMYKPENVEGNPSQRVNAEASKLIDANKSLKYRQAVDKVLYNNPQLAEEFNKAQKK